MTVGIAVALYNGARFLEQQLDTLRLQTCPADKVVFCDDGSSDNTVALVSAYIEKYDLSSTWELIQNETNLGYVRNFYKAMSLCGTDLIYLSDQDDIWETDKLEKMNAVMQAHPEANLLSCRYGIMDADGHRVQSFVEGAARQDEEILPIGVKDIMQAYRWPGMILCVRGDFFRALPPQINHCKVAHDFMFCMCAADRDSFLEYGYLGAYHRRHDNNTAREEHRISKLLNLEKKLTEIAATKTLWEEFLSAKLDMKESTQQLLTRRLDSLRAREDALAKKNIWKIFAVYRNDPDHFLRLKSFICDLWLVVFGKKPSSGKRR